MENTTTDETIKTVSDETLNIIDEYIGSRIKLRRNLLGLSQSQLAQTLNVSFQQLQKYEKGSNRISGSRMWHISHALNTPISYFFDGIDRILNHRGLSVNRFSNDCLYESSTEFGILQQPYEVQLAIHELIGSFTRINDDNVRNKILDLVQSIADTNVKTD